jgi:hypothetical protein
MSHKIDKKEVSASVGRLLNETRVQTLFGGWTKNEDAWKEFRLYINGANHWFTVAIFGNFKIETTNEKEAVDKYNSL